jgi:hypothetical protein
MAIITIIFTLTSIAIGGVVTFLVTRSYYKRASGDLEREAGELKDYTVMLINYLHDARVIDVERDAHGSPVRVRVINREVTDSGGISDSVEANLIREVDQQPSEQNRSVS